MYKMFKILSFLLVGISFGCGNSDKERHKIREQKYVNLLEEEYDIFLDSERYKRYKQRYELLCELTEKIDNDTAFVTLDSLTSTDSLCFIPAEDLTEQPQVEFRTFETYRKKSDQVTAAIVFERFYEKEYSDKFSNEFQWHDAYMALDRDTFLKRQYAASMDSSSEFVYMGFCNAREDMDKLINCKYFIVLKTFDESEYTLLPQTEAGDYLSGYFRGILYVYNIEKRQMESALNLVIKNSSTVSIRSGQTVDRVFKADLQKNVQLKIKATLDSAYGVKGDLPEFYF